MLCAEKNRGVKLLNPKTMRMQREGSLGGLAKAMYAFDF